MDKSKGKLYNIEQKEGILVDLQDIHNNSNTSNINKGNNICCINMSCYNCNRCYIKEYYTKKTIHSKIINKPLIDLYTISKKYNIDDIVFINNKNN